MLQPHEGPSETRLSFPIRPGPRPLQPHEGPSETGGGDTTGVRVDRGFNPTRVRLKPRSRSNSTRTLGGFNPTRVRLKPQIMPESVEDIQASTPRGSV